MPIFTVYRRFATLYGSFLEQPLRIHSTNFKANAHQPSQFYLLFCTGMKLGLTLEEHTPTVFEN